MYEDQIQQYLPFSTETYKKIALYKIAYPVKRIEHTYSGIVIREFNGIANKETWVDGVKYGLCQNLNQELSIQCFTNNELNGYFFYKDARGYVLMTFDMGEEIEAIFWSETGELRHINSLEIKAEHLDIDKFMSKYPGVIQHIDEAAHRDLWSSLIEVAYMGAGVEMELGQRLTWAYERKQRMQEGMYTENSDFLPYYIQQNELSKKVIKEDVFPSTIKYIGGVDVAYNESELRMVGAIVILDADTLEVVEEAYHEMEITFPYVPGLFSFREIPPLLEAYQKLKIKPDLIICDGHGIAHPKKIGMATHLGIELDIPTIGCGKTRLIGIWNPEQLGEKRGDYESLIWEEEEIGVALRTQDKIKPLFISIGHKISLASAIQFTLKMCSQYRLPETTRMADQLVNRLMKEQTEIDFLDKEQE